MNSAHDTAATLGPVVARIFAGAGGGGGSGNLVGGDGDDVRRGTSVPASAAGRSHVDSRSDSHDVFTRVGRIRTRIFAAVAAPVGRRGIGAGRGLSCCCLGLGGGSGSQCSRTVIRRSGRGTSRSGIVVGGERQTGAREGVSLRRGVVDLKGHDEE